MTMFIHRHRTVINFAIKSPFLCKFLVSFSLNFSTTPENQLPVSTPSVSEFLMHKHHFSPQLAARVSSVLTNSKNPDKYDSILSFLKDNGFSSTQLEKIVEYRPRFLVASLENVIMPKIMIFQDLGISSHDIAEIIANNPDILHRSASNRVIPALSVLKGLLGSNVEVVRLLKVSGWFLKYDTESTLVPNFEFLKSCGIHKDHIVWLMYNFPRSLLCKPETMRKFVEKIDEAGIKRSSKMFVHAIRVLGSMTSESWELKLQAFRDVGFSEDNIAAAFKSAPQVFSVSEEKMKKLKEVLIATGKYDVLCMVNNPTSLICSIEKRYKPRLEVLMILERKNLIKGWPCFSSMYKYTDAQFFEKYVGPYFDEVGKTWLYKSGFTGKGKV